MSECKKSRPVVYISGPITAEMYVQERDNVAAAAVLWKELRSAGFAPVCPHLTWHLQVHTEIGDMTTDDWMEVDLPVLERCDIVVRLPDTPNRKSEGATREVEHAQKYGIPVYHWDGEVGNIEMFKRFVWTRVSNKSYFSAAGLDERAKAATGNIPVAEPCCKPRGYSFPASDDADLCLKSLNGSRGDDQMRIAKAGLGVTATLLRKNADYGGSAWRKPMLAPNLDVGSAILCRMSDKVARISSLQASGTAEVAESLEDTIRDLAGYSILWLARPEGD